MPGINSSVLSLDVGAKRVGVAVASFKARLPRPLTTLLHDEAIFQALDDIVEAEGVSTLVVGYPRGMQGQQTKQTDEIEEFCTELSRHFSIPIHLQDEALTSRQAEAELEDRGKPYSKGDIDALAATYILEDYLNEQGART
jgi:putative Holliday junction resolvase